MRSQRTIIVCLLLWAAGGCRTDPAITALERENSQLEGVIYRQREIIDDYRYRLEAGGGCATPVIDGPELAPARPAAEDDRPARTSPVPGLGEDLEEPDVEMPAEAVPSDQVPEMFRTPRGRGEPDSESPRFAPPSGSGAAGRVPAREAGIRTNKKGEVAQIRLAKVVVRDGNSGPTSAGGGLSLLVEARDADGRVLPVAAPVSVVVLDPAARGAAARVARWDFSADEVGRLLGRSPAAKGIPLEMVWPDAPPTHDRLHVYVRYTTADGRKVETDGQIDLNVAAVRGPNWTTAGPSTSPSTSPSATSPQPDRARSTASRASAPAPVHRPAWSPDRL